MARWPEDDVDCACKEWAHQWVSAFAKAPDRASRAIGPLGCTLGRVIERHDGAASSTERDRHWPEVFTGYGLCVSIILKAMSDSSRDIIFAHYVARWYDGQFAKQQRPVKQRVIAERLGLSLPEYYSRRDTAKSCIRVGLSLDSNALLSARDRVIRAPNVAVDPATIAG